MARSATGYDPNAPGRKTGYASPVVFCFKDKTKSTDIAGEDITMGVIPPNVTITGGYCRWDALGGTTTNIDIGTAVAGTQLLASEPATAAGIAELIPHAAAPIGPSATETTIYLQYDAEAPDADANVEIVITGYLHQP